MSITIVSIISNVLYVYSLLIIARALMSWLPNLDPSNPIVRFLVQVTEPVLRPVREMMPSMGGMDLSPLVVIIAIQVVMRLLYALL